MFFELESFCNLSVSTTMRFGVDLRLKLLNWLGPPNRLFLQHKNISNCDELRLRALNGARYALDDDEPDPKSINLLRENNLALNFAMFPSIKIGYSPLIRLYGEDATSLNMDSDLINLEEYEKVDKKIPEPWHSLGSTSVRSMPPPFIEENQEENFAEEPLLKTITPWEGVLDRSVKLIPNITSWHANKLESSGFPTIRKLLNHFPRTYADLQNAQEDAIIDGHYYRFGGEVISSNGRMSSTRAQLGILQVVVECEFRNFESNLNENKMIYLHLWRFFHAKRPINQYFLNMMASKYKKGDRLYVSGKVKKMTTENHYEMVHYKIDMLGKEEERDAHLEEKPYPLYPSKAGLKPSYIAEAISKALNTLNNEIDPMPSEVLSEFSLCNLFDAYSGIHRPETADDADLARRRLIFDEFFYLQLGRLFQMLEAIGTNLEREELLARYKNHKISEVCSSEWSPLTRSLLNSLPYFLTNSQLTALSEIILDLKKPIPMNRLLQGDVGCGKTIVAFLACMEVVGSGFQAALMVPTELLAIQHYHDLSSLFEHLNLGENEFKPKLALLTGSTSKKESRLILQGLQSGDISMVIGTHSLISEKIEYCSLKIAVIDEQHRFGVVQRGRFNSKLLSRLRDNSMNTDLNSDEDKAYMAPHILAISATPIPRTLALALYGDMSLTQITDLPPGRQPIETLALEGDQDAFEKVYKVMKDELAADGKIYMVYPIIEESENLPELRAAASDYESISDNFKDYHCSLLHGRMKAEEKEEALRNFRDGPTRILVATQVIEIGVDVPDASMMVVFNAERFGIAQLHQLRGRVGRGNKKSRCVLLSSTPGALKRLKILESSSDGFYLAQADLLLRGPGDLLGKKQSGHIPEFPIARLEVDGDILQQAHLAALKVLTMSNNLEKYPGLKAELSMRQPLCILGD